MDRAGGRRACRRAAAVARGARRMGARRATVSILGFVCLGLSVEVGTEVTSMLVHGRRWMLASGERDDPRVHENVNAGVALLALDDQQPRNQVFRSYTCEKEQT